MAPLTTAVNRRSCKWQPYQKLLPLYPGSHICSSVHTTERPWLYPPSFTLDLESVFFEEPGFSCEQSKLGEIYYPEIHFFGTLFA